MMIGSSAATKVSVRAKVTSGPVPRSGPLITYETSWMATKFSMMVVTTSCAPVNALRKPGMKPQAMPPSMPAMIDDRDRHPRAGIVQRDGGH